MRFIFTKIKNKYRLYIALMIGVICMIAAFGVILMLRKGSLDRVIQSEFVSANATTGEYPAALNRSGTYLPEAGVPAAEGVVAEMGSYESTWDTYLNIPVISSQRLAWFKGRRVEFSYRGIDGYLDVGFYEGGYENGHFKLLDGVNLSEAGDMEAGHYPCLISRYDMDVDHMVVGETLTMHELGGAGNPDIVFHVVGIVEEDGYEDYFWHKGLKQNGLMMYVSPEVFSRIVEEHGVEKILYDTTRFYDYRKLTVENADAVEDYLAQFSEKDELLTENLSPSLVQARQKGTSVKAALYAISVPLLLLVVLFIGMISVRIVSSERTEIAMLHSRGMKRSRILLIYLIQSLLIAGAAFAPGLLLGYGAGKLTASVTGFLTFSKEPVRGYGMDSGMILMSAAAALLSVLIMLLPVVPQSKSTVVETKKQKIRSGSPLWEKFFVDIVLLGISVYLLYDYSKQLDSLKMSVLSGEGIDPMIFLDSTLFLISCGILILRLMSYLVRLIFRIGRKRFKPATYASLLQIIRTRRGAGVISVFLVLTIAMSIFNANMARTVSANQEARIRYNTGTDVTVTENWQIRVLSQDTPQQWTYREPDYSPYESLVKEGLADSVTRVICDNKTEIRIGRTGQEIGTLMAVNTKEFGETAKLDERLTEEHWFNYLNALSQTTNGVLISRNLADKYELSVGDTLTYSRFSPLDASYVYASSAGTVTGIVDAFPGYNTVTYETNEQGQLTERENFLIVANYANTIVAFEKTPYSVWIRTSHTGEEIRTALEQKLEAGGRTLKSVVSTKEQISEMQATSMIKITNGLFTLDFLVALLLCVIGYLIHWITSIRDRGLLFGIYRAMGISMREVNRMLTLEQLFLSLGPVLAGVGAGSLATLLFSKLFAVVYLPEKHAVPLSTFVSGTDLLRLAVIIGASIIICFIIIRQIIRRMKITDALKMGDD
ncbi:MAG: ABC transporter permease [Eubacterium sp.]|nr:ABC transporter permease [Eubacterium sp.]